MTTHADPVTPLRVTREDWHAAVADIAERVAARRERQATVATVGEVAEFEAQARARELEAHMDAWARNVPARFRSACLEDLTGEPAELAESWDGTRNVLMLGAVGVGKTHAAVAMARHAYETSWKTVIYAPAVELLDDLRPGGPEDTMVRVCQVDVLVLDDLGAERPTDWTGERLYLLVNRRWLEQRPTIVTSNLSAADLEQAMGARMWSRLWHDAVALELAGPDRRRDHG